MCCRYYIDEDTLAEALAEVPGAEAPEPFPFRGDIHPADAAPVLLRQQNHLRTEICRWGWETDFGFVINARSETAAQKHLFRTSLMLRRCAVPVRAFYEWDREKMRYTFTRPGKQPFFLAGFFDRPLGGEDPPRFVVLTRSPDAVVEKIHNRMPVLLDGAAAARWTEDTQRTPAFRSESILPLQAQPDIEQLRLDLD
jgi:putative SOS response-associated peptidase YedK